MINFSAYKKLSSDLCGEKKYRQKYTVLLWYIKWISYGSSIQTILIKKLINLVFKNEEKRYKH